MNIDGTVVNFGGVVLTGVQLPSEPPMPTFEIRQKIHQMSEGSTGTGFPVVQTLGARAKTWEWRFEGLDAATLSSLEALAVAQEPFTVTVTVPSLYSVQYRVMFDEDGFVPSVARYAEFTSNFYRVTCTLLILSKL